MTIIKYFQRFWGTFQILSRWTFYNIICTCRSEYQAQNFPCIIHCTGLRKHFSYFFPRVIPPICGFSSSQLYNMVILTCSLPTPKKPKRKRGQLRDGVDADAASTNQEKHNSKNGDAMVNLKGKKQRTVKAE